MRTLLAFVILTLGVSAHAGGPADRVKIYLLDPRGEIEGEQTMPTQWNDRKADLIATRTLNVAEARKLLEPFGDQDKLPFHQLDSPDAE